MIYSIEPVAKPRMTQRDKWARRPAVIRYMAFKDMCRLHGVKVPLGGADITFFIPMPRSWSVSKKTAMDGLPHMQKPDIDNLLKALLDAVYQDDAKVWNIARLQKLWAYNGAISIEQ